MSDEYLYGLGVIILFIIIVFLILIPIIIGIFIAMFIASYFSITGLLWWGIVLFTAFIIWGILGAL